MEKKVANSITNHESINKWKAIRVYLIGNPLFQTFMDLL